MTRIELEIDDTLLERLENLPDIEVDDRKTVILSMIEYCMDEEYSEWSIWHGSNNQIIDELAEELEEDWSPDLNEGIHPQSTEDLPGSDPSEDDLEFAQEQTQTETVDDILEDIDDL